jgi:hypothetical protein
LAVSALKKMVPMKALSIHVSDMRSFDMCRRRWWFSSVNSMNLERHVPVPALWLGTGVHVALDAFYSGKNPLEIYDAWLAQEWKRLQSEHAALWPEEVRMLEEQGSLGRSMVAHYRLWARRHDFFKVLRTEQAFSIPIRIRPGARALPKARYEGRLDGLVEDDRGRIWVLEHKTCRRFPNEKTLDFNDQATGYVLGAEEVFGVKPSGVIFNYLKKSVPVVPKVLKSGGLSVNRAQNTSPEVVLAALRARELPHNEEPYLGYLEYLDTSPHKFFRRYTVYRAEEEVAELREKLYWVTREMRKASLPIWPSYAWYACTLGCPFEGPCKAMSIGANWRLLLEAQFRQRQPYYDRPESESDDDD